MAETRLKRRSPIGLYRAGITSPERLEKTSIGREEMLGDLLQKIEHSTGKRTHQHYAFIGPRGVGKTHFLSLLVNRIESRAELRDKLTVVRFPEETHRLLSFADFLLRTCEILAQSDSDGEWQTLYEQLAEEDDDRRVIDTLEPKLNHYRQETGRVLLLLLENLDEVLTRQIKGSQDVHHLRKFLMTSPSCILVATAPIMFPGLTDVERPFYDFIDVQVLDNLTQQQTVDAIRVNLQYDGREDLLDRFDELSPKIKALHEMTGGNPRLVMMHYSLMADEDVLEVQQQFAELLDQISPFYQDRIKDLPPQERAVLETMALIREELKTPALIARKLRKSPQQASSLLQRLTKSGYLVVTDHPNDKRSKVYRIKEGFFDIWLSTNESRKQRKRLPVLTRFFEMWYQRKEREQKRRELFDQLRAKEAGKEETDRRAATLAYLSDAGTDEEKIAAKVQLASAKKETGRADEAAAHLEEAKALRPGGVMRWLTDRRELWADGSRWVDPFKQVEEMIECWQLQRAGKLEEFASRLLKIGRSLQAQGIHEALADLLLSNVDELHDPEAKIHVLLQAAQSQKMIGDLQAALQTTGAALDLARNTKDRKLEGTTLNNLSLVYHARGDYATAEKYLQESLQISREIGDKAGEGTTLNNLATAAHARGDYATAEKYLQESLQISREIGNKAGEGTTLNNLSLVYDARGDYATAEKYLQESLQILREIGDKAGEGATLNNLATAAHARGDYATAEKYLQESLQIHREIGNKAGEGTTLNNLATAAHARGDYATAETYLQASLQISRKIGNKVGIVTTLHNLAHIAVVAEDVEKAIGHWDEAFALAVETGVARELFYVGRQFGHVLIAAERWEEARKVLEVAAEVGRQSGMPETDEVESLLEKVKQGS